MPFNISDFRATTNKYKGFTKSSKFEMLIPNLEDIGVLPPRDLRFFAAGITMPGFQFGTDSVLHHGIGFPEERAVAYEINPVIVEFLVDQEQKVYQFFYEWLKKISNFDLSPNASQSYLIEPFLFSLPETYTAQIQINQFDETAKVIREFYLYNAYPKTINSFDLNWSSVNQIQTLIVEFEYRRWSTRHGRNISDASGETPVPQSNPRNPEPPPEST